MKVLLMRGADPNSMNKEGSTPLHKAYEQRNEMIQRLLLSHGANPNIKNAGGLKPMNC